MLRNRKWLFAGLVIVFLFPAVASAQAVFLARKALGLVSHISDQFQGHESASVLLEADADKVYSKAEKIIAEKPENEILARNKAERTISFRHSGQTISLKVARLQDDLAQILVLSSGGESPQNTTFAINGILRICNEVGVHCSVCKD